MKQRRGQSTVEYAVLAAVVIGAMLAMQIYVKRGAMGKLRESTDKVGEQFTPLSTTSDFTSKLDVVRKEVVSPTGLTTSTITKDEKRSRTGDEHVKAKLDQETLF